MRAGNGRFHQLNCEITGSGINAGLSVLVAHAFIRSGTWKNDQW